MDKFARDIIIAFLSDSNTQLLKLTIMRHYSGANEINKFLDSNLKRMQMSFSHYIERDFANVDPLEGTTVADHVGTYNSDFVAYAVRQIDSEVMPELVPDYSVYEPVERRNMRKAASADEILASWYDNPAPLDQYREDPQACRGGAKYNPRFDDINRYADEAKASSSYCGSASSDWGLREFDPRTNTWRCPAAKYPYLTNSDTSKFTKYSSDKSFNPNANTYDTFISGGRRQNEYYTPGPYEPYMSSPPVRSQCNTMTQNIFHHKSFLPKENMSLGPYPPLGSPCNSFNNPASLTWRQNINRIPPGGAGVNFCDQSTIGGDLYYDMQFQTMYMLEMNKDPEPHTAHPFGWSCPESDNRLLSRRTFRNNEAGIENGIPRYEQRLQRRNLDRDIDEDLRDTQYDFQQRGHDMSDLWQRTNNKKHVIDPNRDRVNITDQIRYDSLRLRENDNMKK